MHGPPERWWKLQLGRPKRPEKKKNGDVARPPEGFGAVSLGGLSWHEKAFGVRSRRFVAICVHICIIYIYIYIHTYSDINN